MSLSILQELDHPTHPRSQAEASIVEQAQSVYDVGRLYAPEPYLDVLHTEVEKHVPL